MQGVEQELADPGFLQRHIRDGVHPDGDSAFEIIFPALRGFLKTRIHGLSNIMTAHQLQGVLPVLQLPLTASNEIDYACLDREIDFLFESGAAGAVLAMVSEIIRLTDDTRDQLVGHVVKSVAGRGPVIVSVAAESLAQELRHAYVAEREGCDALMAQLPITHRVPQEEQASFFQALLDSVSLPVIIQDSSGYLGFAVSMEVQLELFQRNPGRVHFKPETSPVGPSVSRLYRETGGEALVFDGTGGKFLMENFERGVAGVIPGCDTPWAVAALWAALKAGNLPKALRIQSLLAMIFLPMTSLESYLATEKFFLHFQGVFPNERILPPARHDLDEISRRHLLRILSELADECKQCTAHWLSK